MRKRPNRVRTCLLLLLLVTVAIPAGAVANAASTTRTSAGVQVPPRFEYAMNVFDWTVGWTDFDLFRRMVDQLPSLGFTTVELGVPWDSVQTAPDRYDFSAVDRRVEYVQSKGLRLRLRVNVQDYPAWFKPVLMERPDGSTDLRGYGHRTGVPSFFDQATTAVQQRWVDAVARHYAGHGFAYTLGVGVHFELKYGGWYSYEPPARVAFRRWLAHRYGTVAALNAAWQTDYPDFDTVQPPVPGPTAEPTQSTTPDTSARNADWIRFREQALTHLVAAYYKGIRASDPTAFVSSPLGESFRSQSAEFGNQDIAGLARHADGVVFSYDFFIGGGTDSLWNLAAMVRTYSDITERPVVLEIDGPGLIDQYGDDYVYEAGVKALDSGAAGLNVANYTYQRNWVENLAQFPALGRLGDYIRHLNATRSDVGRTASRSSPTSGQAAAPTKVLYFVSKWTQYAYRSPSEWLHSYQFGMLSLLLDQDIAVKVATDENVLSTPMPVLCAEYKAVVLPYNVVIDPPVRARLEALLRCLPAIQDMRLADTTPTGSAGGSLVQLFGLRPAGEANPVSARVDSTGVLESFTQGDLIRLQGLGQPTPSQHRYEPIDNAVRPQAMSPSGGVVWARDGRTRRITLGYNAGEVYVQGGFKNQTCAVLVDALRWLGAPLPACRSVADITPPVYDFARAAAAARTGVETRSAGLSAGAAYVASGGALDATPPDGPGGGRVLATYDADVPADAPSFSAAAALSGAGTGPAVLSLIAERADGTPVPILTTALSSTESVPVHATLEQVAGEHVRLRLSVSSETVDGAGSSAVRLVSPVVSDANGNVVLDLAAEASSATLETEVASTGLSAGAQFFNQSATSIKAHPPWVDATGATFAAYSVELPDLPTRLETKLAKETAAGDGTVFSVTVVDAHGAPHLVAIRHVTSTEPAALTATLTDFAGQTVTVVLRVDAGFADSSAYDATYLLQPRITADQ
ncbi:MAG TPA: beta-galactosidase [Actinopolymorphaceae bacterium]